MYTLTASPAKVADVLIAAVDGATVLRNGQTLEAGTTGYVVAYGSPRSFTFPSYVGYEMRLTYISAFIAEWWNHADAFGIWIDNDSVYLDVVEIETDRETAIAKGIARNQIAIWDNGAMDEIATGGTGK